MINYKIILGLAVTFSLMVTLMTYASIRSDPAKMGQRTLNYNSDDEAKVQQKQAFLRASSLVDKDPEILKEEIETLRTEIKALKMEFKRLGYDPAKIISSNKNSNPFYVLGAYPDISYVYEKKPNYNLPHLGLINEEDYCTRVDLYNLAHPENMFEKRNYFSDYAAVSLPRKYVMDRFGNVPMPYISFLMKDFKNRKFKLDITITNFFVNNKGVMDLYHELGKHFCCATQMYNHIPGHRDLIRKDSLLDRVTEYAAEKYGDRPQCFTKNMYFPKFFRLYNEQECKDFFQMLHSEEYLKSLEKEPIQYLVKIGRGSHKGQGVYLLDDAEGKELDELYQGGEVCGVVPDSLIVQGYITNPLLLDMGNKFDFRLYVTIASTNPMIVYYHDGFLRVALSKFDKTSQNKATHLTNTFLADQVIAEAAEKKELIHGMTEDQLKEYHLWTFDELQEYLIEIGRVTNPNWLAEELRPAIYKVIIHVLKMTSKPFLKHSSVYALMGLDFILDNDFNLWFIEANPSPLLTGTTQYMTYFHVIKDMFDINYAYYKSRMLRVTRVIKRYQKDMEDDVDVDLDKYKEEFLDANKNRLEPEYPVPKGNGYTLIMDENLPGADAYFGSISPDCVMDP